MGQNIKKFTSTAEYDAFRSTDGWAYPNVSFIETNILYGGKHGKRYF